VSAIATKVVAGQRQLPGNPLIAISNEIVKGLRHGWAERAQILIEVPMFTSFMLMLAFIVGQSGNILSGRMSWAMDPAKASWLFLGFGVYMFVYLQIQKLFWRMLAEIQTGTMEQTYLSSLPSWVHIIVGRAISATIEAGVVVSIMYVVTNLVFKLDLTWRPDALIPMFFVLVGGAGFSLIIAGCTLVWKRVEMFNDLLLLFLMLASGAVIATDKLPSVLRLISPFVFLTQPVAGIRRIMLDNQSLTLWGTGGYVWMTTTTLGWIAAGVTIFRICENSAKRSGALGRY